jgi:hypothetical protein
MWSGSSSSSATRSRVPSASVYFFGSWRRPARSGIAWVATLQALDTSRALTLIRPDLHSGPGHSPGGAPVAGRRSAVSSGRRAASGRCGRGPRAARSTRSWRRRGRTPCAAPRSPRRPSCAARPSVQSSPPRSRPTPAGPTPRRSPSRRPAHRIGEQGAVHREIEPVDAPPVQIVEKPVRVVRADGPVQAGHRHPHRRPRRRSVRVQRAPGPRSRARAAVSGSATSTSPSARLGSRPSTRRSRLRSRAAKGGGPALSPDRSCSGWSDRGSAYGPERRNVRTVTDSPSNVCRATLRTAVSAAVRRSSGTAARMVTGIRRSVTGGQSAVFTIEAAAYVR